MRTIIVLAAASLVLAGCTTAEKPSNTAGVQRYPIRGKVLAVDRPAKKATIEHEDIPGYMSAMTMDFPIHEDWVWDDLAPGSEIRAELVVDKQAKDPYWLEKIGIIAAPDPNRPAPPINENAALVGKDVPDFTLTDQDGKRISLKDYRGKALAITFIYAQCPLPDYCIKMSVNFSDLANQLKDDAELRDKIRLLSISFDPERDTPEKLRQYGAGYLGDRGSADFSVWQLAVGSDKDVRPIADFFGLRYEISPEDKTQFTHSLRTAVISPQGKVTRVYTGNDWTPGDLRRALIASME